MEFYGQRAARDYGKDDFSVGENVVLIEADSNTLLIVPTEEWEKKGGVREGLLGPLTQYQLELNIKAGTIKGVVVETGYELGPMPSWLKPHVGEVNALLPRIAHHFQEGPLKMWHAWAGSAPLRLLLWQEEVLWH